MARRLPVLLICLCGPRATAAKTWPLRIPLENEKSLQTFSSGRLCFSIFCSHSPHSRFFSSHPSLSLFLSLSVFLATCWLMMMIAAKSSALTDCFANSKAFTAQHAGFALGGAVGEGFDCGGCELVDWMWSPGAFWDRVPHLFGFTLWKENI